MLARAIQAHGGGDLRPHRSRRLQADRNGFWVRQRSADGQSIINAATSREQGVLLSNVTAFVFDQNNRFVERIEAKAAAA